MASSELTGFISLYAETLALALTFANSSLTFSFCSSHSIICFCCSSSDSAVNWVSLILSISSFSLDDFNPPQDPDSFDVFDLFDVFDAEVLLLLLDELFDLFSSSAFFSQHVVFLLKENNWLPVSSNHSYSLTLSSSSKSVLCSS